MCALEWITTQHYKRPRPKFHLKGLWTQHTLVHIFSLLTSYFYFTFHLFFTRNLKGDRLVYVRSGVVQNCTVLTLVTPWGVVVIWLWFSYATRTSYHIWRRFARINSIQQSTTTKWVSFLNHQYEIFSDLRNDFRYALAYKKKYTPTIAGVWQEFHAKNSPVYLQIN